MDLISFVQQPKPYEFKYGDFNVGDCSMWFRPYVASEFFGVNRLDLRYIDPNPWQAIATLTDWDVLDGEQMAQIHAQSAYDCPYTNKTYNSFVPINIFSENLDTYFPKERKPWYHDMATDKSWNCDDDESHLLFERLRKVADGAIVRCVLGPGYGEGTRINDGDGTIQPVVIDLSNGDRIVGLAHVWHNK